MPRAGYGVSRSRLRIPEPYRDLARAARKAGWVIEPSGKGHLRWTAPDGSWVITAATPSSWGARDDRAKLRRAGLADAA